MIKFPSKFYYIQIPHLVSSNWKEYRYILPQWQHHLLHKVTLLNFDILLIERIQSQSHLSIITCNALSDNKGVDSWLIYDNVQQHLAEGQYPIFGSPQPINMYRAETYVLLIVLLCLNSISLYFQLQKVNPITLYIKSKGIVSIMIRLQEQSRFNFFSIVKMKAKPSNASANL